jgi:hypothetical protein
MRIVTEDDVAEQARLKEELDQAYLFYKAGIYKDSSPEGSVETEQARFKEDLDRIYEDYKKGAFKAKPSEAVSKPAEAEPAKREIDINKLKLDMSGTLYAPLMAPSLNVEALEAEKRREFETVAKDETDKGKREFFQNAVRLQTTPLSNVPNNNDPLTKIMGYIPGPAIGVFLAIDAYIRTLSGVSVVLYWMVFIAITVGAAAYAWRDTKKPPSPSAPRYRPSSFQTGIAVASFIIWAYTIGGPFAFYAWYSSAAGAILVLLWTFFIPLFVQTPKT